MVRASRQGLDSLRGRSGDAERVCRRRGTISGPAAAGSREVVGDHPDPAKRLSPEEIEAIAQRLAGYLHSWTSPNTPPGMIQQFYAEWSTFMDDPLPADSASQISQMVQPPTAVPGREDDGDGEGEK